MTGNWFLAKIKCERAQEDGTQKKVVEQYLVDALSFTEAEARITEQTAPYVTGEYKVIGLNPMNLSEIWPSDKDEADKWYKIKSSFITLDEKSGKEKKTPSNYLVQGWSTASAEAEFNERMKGTMADYVVESVVETKILDVYPYIEEKETEETK